MCVVCSALCSYDEDDFEPGVPLPDIGVDPEDHLLTAVNTSAAARVFYISTRHAARGGGGRPLRRGVTRADAGVVTPCTTFVLLVRAAARERGGARFCPGA